MTNNLPSLTIATRLSKDTFGVFVVIDGAWELLAAYFSRSSAQDEARYLNEVLGQKAQVFVRA